MIPNFSTIFLYLIYGFGFLITILAISSQIIKIANILGLKIWIYNKSPVDKSLRYVQLLSLITVSVIALSYVLNLGWIRMFLILPTLISILAFDYICKNIQYLTDRRKNLILSGLSILFAVSYLMLPDFGDTPDSTRVFFGTTVGSSESMILLVSSFSVYLIFIVLLLYTFIKIKKSKSNLTKAST